MIWKLFIQLFVLAAAALCRCAGRLIMKPHDTDVKVNQSTYFNCSTDHGPQAIFWFHRNKHVYTGIAILEPYHERFEINLNVWNGTYIYNLVIRSVQPGDAGQYVCAEDEGVGDKYSVQLVVLDGDPICRSNIELDKVIGQNACNVEPDEVELSCSGTYYGNIPPQLQWKKDGDDKKISESLSTVTSGNHYNYTLRLKGDISLDKSSYVCHATRTVHDPYQCASKVINVLYVLSDNTTDIRSIGDKILCRANTTQSCKYKWRWFGDNDVMTESSSAILIPNKTGLHKCEAECYLRNQRCKLLVRQTMVYGEKESNSKTTIVMYVVFVVVIVAQTTGLAYCCAKRRRRRYLSLGEKEQYMGKQNTASGPKTSCDESEMEAKEYQFPDYPTYGDTLRRRRTIQDQRMARDEKRSALEKEYLDHMGQNNVNIQEEFNNSSDYRILLFTLKEQLLIFIEVQIKAFIRSNNLSDDNKSYNKRMIIELVRDDVPVDRSMSLKRKAAERISLIYKLKDNQITATDWRTIAYCYTGSFVGHRKFNAEFDFRDLLDILMYCSLFHSKFYLFALQVIVHYNRYYGHPSALIISNDTFIVLQSEICRLGELITA